MRIQIRNKDCMNCDGNISIGSRYVLMRELARFPKDRSENRRDSLAFDLINSVSSGATYQDENNWQNNRFQGLW